MGRSSLFVSTRYLFLILNNGNFNESPPCAFDFVQEITTRGQCGPNDLLVAVRSFLFDLPAGADSVTYHVQV